MNRVAISGCGSVSKIYYAPTLRALEAGGALRLVGAFDPDTAAAENLFEAFPEAVATGTFEDLLGLKPDLIIIASPPQFHCDQVVRALNARIAVLCEKPLATSLGEAQRMASAAEAAGRMLAVGMPRRRLAAARAIRSLIKGRTVGEVRRIEIFEGGPFTWPVRSPAYFDPGKGGVGVLEDIGTHILDLICWWLGEPEVIAYDDDAMGGVAANCRLVLRIGGAEATIRISRDWHRENVWRIEGDDGVLVWRTEQPDDLDLELPSADVRGRVNLTEESLDRRAVTFERAFADQLLDAVSVATGQKGSIVPAGDSFPVLSIIDRCKEVRGAMAMPWLK